jgi:hypothetical protein
MPYARDYLCIVVAAAPIQPCGVFWVVDREWRLFLSLGLKLSRLVRESGKPRTRKTIEHFAEQILEVRKNGK